MNDILSSIVVLFVGALLLAVTLRKHEQREQRLMALSFGAHVVATLAQIGITRGVYEGGDMTTYMAEGSLVARAIELDPQRFGKLWLALLLQQDPEESLPVLGVGMSTGSMVALAAALALVFRYSLYGACFAIAIASCLGKLALYRAFRELLPANLRIRALIAVSLLPSTVFWSSGIVKEAFVIAGIGPFWLGVHRLLRGKPLRGLVLTLVGAAPIALLKPYTLFALVVAAGAWVGVDRLHARSGRTGAVRIRPLYIVLSALIIYAGVIALGRIYPTYSVENLGEDLARHQGLGVIAGGGSYYRMGDAEAMSLQKQIAFAPLAIATALFRPFVFEARNPLAFAASLETTVLIVLLLHVLFRTGFRTAVRTVLSTPVLFSSIVFTLTFGMAVGLATTNFGSLARYRTPLIPFYGAVLFVLGSKRLTRVTAAPHAAAAQTMLPTRSPREAAGRALMKARLERDRPARS